MRQVSFSWEHKYLQLETYRKENESEHSVQEFFCHSEHFSQVCSPVIIFLGCF